MEVLYGAHIGMNRRFRHRHKDQFFSHPLNKYCHRRNPFSATTYLSNNKSAQVGRRTSGVVQICLRDALNPNLRLHLER
jgi:hypothetical protein